MDEDDIAEKEAQIEQVIDLVLLAIDAEIGERELKPETEALLEDVRDELRIIMGLDRDI